MSIITLLTDFGDRDEYVGAMKGVILTVAPDATIVDITHQIGPQDVTRAGLVLSGAAPYFPLGTVHVAVVDPGVGGNRAIIAAQIGSGIYVAPDNGLLTFVMAEMPVHSAVRVTNPAYFRQPVSNTFHGRDIFAPVAAHLAYGLPMSRLGPAMAADKIERLDIPRPKITAEGTISGAILYADHFGNLATTVRQSDFGGIEAASLVVEVGGKTLFGLSTAFVDVPPGEPLAHINSRGFLEIAVSGGSAERYFGLAKDAPVTVKSANT